MILKDGLEEFLKEITANIDIRTQEKIFEKAENLHRLLATQEKMDSGILAFEILTLCIKEKLSVVDLRWIIDMSGYSNVENKIGNNSLWVVVTAIIEVYNDVIIKYFILICFFSNVTW